jgi:hypothetical protein
VLAVELADARLVDELDRQMPVPHPGRRERGERRRAQLVGCLEVDQVVDPEPARPRGRARSSWTPHAADAGSGATCEGAGGGPA